jgi:hypothetical protein
MPRKKRSTRRRPEPLTGFIEITSVSAGVSVGVVQEGRGKPYASTHGQLELTGKLDEPVRDARDVEIVLYSADENKLGTNPTPSIGLITDSVLSCGLPSSLPTGISTGYGRWRSQAC